MPTNRFYIKPAGNYSQGLNGLTDVLKDRRLYEEEQAEKERVKKVNQGAAEVYKSGDPEAIAEYSLKNPEVAKTLLGTSDLRDTKAQNFYVDSLFQMLQDPDNMEKTISIREGIAKAQGLPPRESEEIDKFMEKYKTDPEGTKKRLEQKLAFLAPEKYKAYREAMGVTAKKPAKVEEFEYFKDLQETNPDLAEQFGVGAGFVEKKGDRTTAAMKNFNNYVTLLATDPEQAKLFGDSIGIARVTPYTDIAKLKSDRDNNLISPEDYEKRRDAIMNPMMKTPAELTTAALRGDPEAKAVLDIMRKDTISLAGEKSKATTEGKLEGLYEQMALNDVAQGILEGKETIDNVHNTFGVPIQEVVRKKVLAIEPDFNFVQPRAIQKSLSSSLLQQQKQRGAMGSFVQNINGQVGKVEKLMKDVISRFGVRALDVPVREFKTLAIGAGDERVLESYTKEISAEIYKLSQGSQASVAMLPEAGRKEWERIHDFSLSWPQLKKVMLGTKDMANIRLKSVNDEIKQTVERLGNIRELSNQYVAKPGEAGAEFESKSTITVVNPETQEEEVWDTKTEKRIK